MHSRPRKFINEFASKIFIHVNCVEQTNDLTTWAELNMQRKKKKEKEKEKKFS